MTPNFLNHKLEKMKIGPEIIMIYSSILKWVKIIHKMAQTKMFRFSKWQFVQKIVGALPRSLAFTLDSCKRFSLKMMKSSNEETELDWGTGCCKFRSRYYYYFWILYSHSTNFCVGEKRKLNCLFSLFLGVIRLDNHKKLS